MQVDFLNYEIFLTATDTSNQIDCQLCECQIRMYLKEKVLKQITPWLVPDDQILFLYLEPAYLKVEEEKGCFNHDEKQFAEVHKYPLDLRLLRLSVNDLNSQGA